MLGSIPSDLSYANRSVRAEDPIGKRDFTSAYPIHKLASQYTTCSFNLFHKKIKGQQQAAVSDWMFVSRVLGGLAPLLLTVALVAHSGALRGADAGPRDYFTISLQDLKAQLTPVPDGVVFTRPQQPQQQQGKSHPASITSTMPDYRGHLRDTSCWLKYCLPR
jgi:hypothetical protein